MNVYRGNKAQYTSVSTAAGAAVIVSTSPAWLFGMAVFALTTGAPNIVVVDATASGLTTFVIGARTSGASVCTTVMLPCPVKMDKGIVANMIAGTAASDYGTIIWAKA